jgi:DNA invertase Pin-like site-specific DNA recombinase
LFWAPDRFSREGMAQTIAHLQRLTSYGVSFHSYSDPHLATDNELVRDVLLALLPSLAKVEAQKIAERTKAGMARASARHSNGSYAAKTRLAYQLFRPCGQIAVLSRRPRFDCLMESRLSARVLSYGRDASPL